MKAFLATQHENGLNKTFELDNKWTLDWVISFKIHIHSKKISNYVNFWLSNEEVKLKV